MMTKLPPNQWVKEKIASWSLNLANNPSLVLFYLLLLSLPSQLGYHFWPSFSFINGLRVDYLSPTLYLSDVIILILFIEMLPYLFTKAPRLKICFVLIPMILLGYLSYRSLSPLNSLVGLTRLIEVVFVSWVISFFLRARVKQVSIILSSSLIVITILTVWQFILQQSVGGWWYYLGERSFTSLTPGIANTSLNGTLVLRPYATFPHPNVLSAFCVILVTFLLFTWNNYKYTSLKVVMGVGIICGIVATFLSMSRSGIAVLLLVGVIWLINSIRSRKKIAGFFFLFILLVGILVYLTGVYLRFINLNFSDQGILIREFLVSRAYTLFLSHFWTGVGLQNFLPSLASELSPLTSLTYFQPVHSLYLLVLSETGLVGAALFCWVLVVLIHRIILSKGERLLKTTLLLVVLLLSLIDHYFYTLHQGQLLLAFVFGVVLVQPGRLFTSLEAKILRTDERSKKHSKRLLQQPLKISRTGGSRAVKTKHKDDSRK